MKTSISDTVFGSKWLQFEAGEATPAWNEWTPASTAFIPLGIATLGGSAISGLGSLVGGIFGSDSATKAAKIQAQAAEKGVALQAAIFNQIQGNLQPFLQGGLAAFTQLQNLTGTADAGGTPTGNPLTSPLTQPFNTTFQASNVPFSKVVPSYGTAGASGPGASPGQVAFAPSVSPVWNPTMAGLEATPGYQFVRDQGLRATQNSFAAQGLGSSGPALAGAAQFASGLASTTYNQQFQNWLTELQNEYNMYTQNVNQQYGIWQGQNALGLQQNQQIYNMLGGLAGSGQNAAAGLGSAGLSAASTSANLLGAAGASTAAGIIGSNNALTSGFSGAANAAGSGLSQYATLQALGLLQGNNSINVNPGLQNALMSGGSGGGFGAEGGGGANLAVGS